MSYCDRKITARLSSTSKQRLKDFDLMVWFSELCYDDQLEHIVDTIKCRYSHPDCSEKLYDFYARQFDESNPQFDKLLQLSVRHNSVDFCRFLLSRPGYKNVEQIKQSLVDSVNNHNDAKLVNLLGGQEWAGVADTYAQAMEAAVKVNHVRAMEELLDLSGGSTDNESDLFLDACERGHVEIAGLLLARADIQFTETAIREAAATGETSILELLLAHGVWCDPSEDGPLYAAISQEQLDSVRLLIDLGAFATSLHLELAIEVGNLEIAQLINESV